MRILLFTFIATVSILVACSKDKAPTNLQCDSEVSFANEIQPIIEQSCISCHFDGNSTGYDLHNYDEVKNNINKVISSLKASGNDLMPQGGPALADSLIKKFECWNAKGKLNN